MNQPEFGPMSVVTLQAENVKRLKAVRIDAGGQKVVPISGRNGQGKSSVLDCIQYALGGKDAQPAKPVRKGAEKAKIVLDLGEIVVRRTIDAAGKQELVVEGKNGARFSSPQALLDRLNGDISFDPTEFMRMRPADQAGVLRRIADLDFSALDGQRARAYDDRTEVNRAVARLKANLQGRQQYQDLERESLADLTAEHAAAAEKYRQREELDRRVKEHRTQAERIKREIAALEARLSEYRDLLARNTREAAELEGQAKLMVVPDMQAIRDRIASAETHNRWCDYHAQTKAITSELEATEAKSRALTEEIERLDREKADRLAAAKLPVEGLGIEGDQVTFNGIPLDQCSQAERLRVSAAIGMAGKPTIRVMLVRDASLLDDDGMRLLAQLADEHGTQIWVERVTNGENVGIVIEDGEVAAAEAGTA